MEKAHAEPQPVVLCYRMHEAELDIPVGWQDQSMQMFRIVSAGDANDASFVITRDYQAGSQAPLGYAQAQHAAIKAKLAEFRLLSLAESNIRSVQTAVIEYEWTARDVVLRQRQAYVPAGECMLILTLTARKQDFEHLGWAWNAVVGSLRLSAPAQRPASSRVRK